MSEKANNVIRLDDYRPKYGYKTMDVDMWSKLHQNEYETKIQMLIDDGWITQTTTATNTIIEVIYTLNMPEANNT